jgi:hypothetical protein
VSCTSNRATTPPAFGVTVRFEKRKLVYDKPKPNGNSGVIPLAWSCELVVAAANGVNYAYRTIGGGDGGPALVLLQHFRGNLDNWNPAFSIGSFVAREITLTRPALVRRLILASSAPQGAAGMHGWAPEVIGAVGQPAPNPDGYLGVFFAGSAESRQAGMETLGRLTARTEDREAHDLADPSGAIRRGMRLGDPRPRPVGTGERDRRTRRRVRRRRRRVPHRAIVATGAAAAFRISASSFSGRLGGRTRLTLSAPAANHSPIASYAWS